MIIIVADALFQTVAQAFLLIAEGDKNAEHEEPA